MYDNKETVITAGLAIESMFRQILRGTTVAF